MDLSVIIPTYNRASILKKTLSALCNQTRKAVEIIIVDDGSTDETSNLIQSMKAPKDAEIRYFFQKNSGQGNARNLGIQKAKGKITLLIGDDMIPSPELIEEHLKSHTIHPEENASVLGKIDWHPELEVSPFMKWMTNGSSILGKYGGHQFAFEKLEGRNEADYNFFYTSNISLKTALLKKYPFDSSFQEYGWEDIELGYRLTLKENLKIYYHPEALALHFHPMDESSLAPRMRQIAKSAFVIDKKYPELHKIPSSKKKIIFWLIGNPLSLLIFYVARKLLRTEKATAYYYYALSKKYYLQGLKSKPETEK